ncbi:integral membrane protein [Lachnospiraceae bacterium KM106-2]|nr:integral membrane protein [Lachnospiraceae bacterium KM106-2]
MKKQLRRVDILKAIKIAVIAVISIITATCFKLQFATTAGIITILSLQNTKRETLTVARKRSMAFMVALLIAWGSYGSLGFTIAAFAIYLFLFSVVCLYFGWTDALAMVSVLMIHFLNAKSMQLGIVINELGLFLIGTGFGVIANLYLRKQGDQYNQLADEVDEQIKKILHGLSMDIVEIKRKDPTSDLERLDKKLRDAERVALQNWNNSLLETDNFEIEYVRIRREQSKVLKRIYASIRMITMVPSQSEMISELFYHIEKEFHRYNTAEKLLEELDGIYQHMRQEELPKERAEFEARALLFYILKQIQEFLEIKRSNMEVIRVRMEAQ